MRPHATTRVRCLDEATSRMRRTSELARVLDGMPQTELVELVAMQPDVLSFEPEVMEVTLASLAQTFGIKKSQLPSVVSPLRHGDPSILTQPDKAKENLFGIVRTLGVGRTEALGLVSRCPSLLAMSEEALISKILDLSQLFLGTDLEADQDTYNDWRLVKDAVLRRPEILLISRTKVKGWLDDVAASLSCLLPSPDLLWHMDLARSMALSKPSLLDEDAGEIMERLKHIMEESDQGIETVLGIGPDRLAEVLSRPSSSLVIWVDHAAVMIHAKSSDWIGSSRGSSRRPDKGRKDNSNLYRMILTRPSLLSVSVALIAGKRRTLDSMYGLLASCLSDCSKEESLDLISNLSIELMADVLVSSYRPLIKLKYLLVLGAEENNKVEGMEEKMAWFEGRVRAALHLSDVAFEQEHPQYKAWLKEQ